MAMFDSHCHLDFPEFDDDRDRIIQHCKQLGLEGILIPGVSRRTWPRLMRVAAQDDMLYVALGLHPLFLDQHEPADLIQLADRVARQRPLAIGEIGLDFYLPDLDKARQLELFTAQLEIAEQVGLPVILHVRKAHDQVLVCLRRRKLKGGIVHAFSGSRQQADHYIELGFKLGFGGAMSFDRASRLRQLACSLPLEAMVLETDAPDMSPAWQNKQRNTPENIPRYCHLLAELRQIPTELIAASTYQNALAVLGLE